MNGKGLDFKHKEVINIKDGRRLRICARCYSRPREWSNNLYNGCKKENRYKFSKSLINSGYMSFVFEREHRKRDYITKLYSNVTTQKLSRVEVTYTICCLYKGAIGRMI